MESVDEEWRPFLTAHVSSMGRYESCTGVVSNPTAAGGYSSIEVDGKTYHTHRAVCVAFGLLSGMDDPLQIDHIDGNMSDNRLVNLQVVNALQNMHSYATGD